MGPKTVAAALLVAVATCLPPATWAVVATLTDDAYTLMNIAERLSWR
jgi:hypothetical protein